MQYKNELNDGIAHLKAYVAVDFERAQKPKINDYDGRETMAARLTPEMTPAGATEQGWKYLWAGNCVNFDQTSHERANE